MQSRKRSWNGPSDTDRLQKRTCSDHESRSRPIRIPSGTVTSIPGHGRRTVTSQQDAQNVCIHKRTCMLSQPTCCVCSDKRPFGRCTGDHRYTTVECSPATCHRSENYCPGCKDSANWMFQRWEILAEPAGASDVESSIMRATNWTSDVLILTCAQKTFRMIRSGDYTMDDLYGEVARLMSCHPAELRVVASDVDLDIFTKSASIDTPLSDVSRIHFRIVDHDDSSDVEMEDL